MNDEQSRPHAEVVVVGSAHMDLIARGPRLPVPGESLLGSNYAIVPGGKAANQAIASAQQGAGTAIVARVGADTFGEELRAALFQKGVDVTHVQDDPRLPTGLCPVLMSDAGDYASIIIPGAGGALAAGDLARASEAIEACRILVVQLEIEMTVSAAAAKQAKAAGARVIFNAAPAVAMARARGWALWDTVDLLIVNRTEASALLEGPVPEGARALAAAESLRRTFDLEAAIVTLGPWGAVVSTVAMQTHVPGHRVAAIDTIGAGDAFAGAIAAAMSRGDELDAALEIAVAASAIAVQREGAFDACPTLREARNLAAGANFS